MLKDKVRKLFENYLLLNNAIAIDFNGVVKIFGKGHIEYYTTRMILLQKQLPQEFVNFSMSYANDYTNLYSDLKEGCFSVLIFLINCDEKVYQLLKKTMKLADKEYEEIISSVEVTNELIFDEEEIPF